jgi:protein-L-isoaspartate(D-aspartate) O-methyltransferase
MEMVKDQYISLRRKMIEEQLVSRGIRDERLLAAMEETPRHRFVPAGLASRSYDDGPLPLGEGQTISQPYMVAEMTQALGLSGKEKVLEIGTGSGYQTAILCKLALEVITVERIATLISGAEKVLHELKLDNVRFLVGDGTMGVPDEAPFDRVIVTAASPDVPAPLFDQLAEGGIMVIPVGDRWEQDLLQVHKEDGKQRRTFLGGCRFVPLLGQFGFHD